MGLFFKCIEKEHTNNGQMFNQHLSFLWIEFDDGPVGFCTGASTIAYSFCHCVQDFRRTIHHGRIFDIIIPSFLGNSYSKEQCMCTPNKGRRNTNTWLLIYQNIWSLYGPLSYLHCTSPISERFITPNIMYIKSPQIDQDYNHGVLSW